MRRPVASPFVYVVPLLAPLFAACGSSSAPATNAPADAGPDLGDPGEFLTPPTSCAYDCPQSGDCAELDAGYTCPALGDWSAIPHDGACGAWDGKQPTPVAGKCTASAPSGEAAKYAGKDPDDPATTILPEGRRVKPLGREFVFHDSPGGLTTFLGAIPGTRLVVTVDTGQGAHVVRVVDVDKLLAGGASPVTGEVKFDAPETLNSSAAFVPPGRIYVATSDAVVQAIDVDLATGALTRDDAASLALPKGTVKPTWHVAAVAASPDGKRLVATPVVEHSALVFDVDPASSTFGKQLGEVGLSANETFMAAFDPHDPTGHFAYVSHWGARSVDELDLSDPAAPKLSRTFSTGQEPEGLAFLDARWLAVANDFADTITLVDRVTGTTTAVPANGDTTLHGTEPSTLAWDATNHRLYATLAGMNALGAWDVDLSPASGGPPTLTPTGRAPTGWWPGGVTVLADGTVVVANMRGGNTEADPNYYAVASSDTSGHMWGTVQAFAAPSSADLVAGEAAVKKNDDVGGLAGAPTVSCPAGVDDFPIPTTNTKGPSKQIQHVIFVVRENKSFDGIFGDFPGVEGKPDLTIMKTQADQDRLWLNFRKAARAFAISDNYYTSAELSEQGHFWTVYGRSADVNERTWPTDQYNRDIRGNPLPLGGVLTLGQPDYGSDFDWLEANHVGLGIFGEALGLPRPVPGLAPVDAQYPGGFSQADFGYPDVERACYVGGRIRVTCDLPAFSYVCLMNDHTHGFGSGASPSSMIAVNDEGTGILLDALSHSPMWASSLVIVTEDDPAGGGEHVDIHRTPVLIASPWVKRGYVSHTHMDVAALHKLFAHVFGLPYPNAIVEHAALPLDLFTSTPDYTPFDHAPRQWPLACGGAPTQAEALLSRSFSGKLDDDPDLGRQVVRALRNEPLRALPADVERRIRDRIAKQQSGAAVDDDGDD